MHEGVTTVLELLCENLFFLSLESLCYCYSSINLGLAVADSLLKMTTKVSPPKSETLELY